MRLAGHAASPFVLTHPTFISTCNPGVWQEVNGCLVLLHQRSKVSTPLPFMWAGTWLCRLPSSKAQEGQIPLATFILTSQYLGGKASHENIWHVFWKLYAKSLLLILSQLCMALVHSGWASIIFAWSTSISKVDHCPSLATLTIARIFLLDCDAFSLCSALLLINCKEKDLLLWFLREKEIWGWTVFIITMHTNLKRPGKWLLCFKARRQILYWLYYPDKFLSAVIHSSSIKVGVETPPRLLSFRDYTKPAAKLIETARDVKAT